MSLSPLDIPQQQFRRVIRGVSATEVQHYLEAVAEQMMAVLAERDDARAALTRCERARDALQAREAEITTAMLTSQRLADATRERAAKEAKLVLQAAELHAEKVLAQAQGQVHGMSEACRELRRDRVRFEEELRGLLNGYARLLSERGDAVDLRAAAKGSVTVLERLRPPTASMPPMAATMIPRTEAEAYAQTS